MKYLKTFESFDQKQKVGVEELAAEILKLAGKNVTPKQVEQSVEKAAEEGKEAQAQAEKTETTDEPTNESDIMHMAGDFLNQWWDLMCQKAYNPEAAEYGPTLTAFGAWVATLVVAAGSATAVWKIGKAIKGLFKGKEVDYTQFCADWSKKNSVDLSKVDIDSEEGKKVMAKCLADFEKSGGKI